MKAFILKKWHLYGYTIKFRLRTRISFLSLFMSRNFETVQSDWFWWVRLFKKLGAKGFLNVVYQILMKKVADLWSYGLLKTT